MENETKFTPGPWRINDMTLPARGVLKISGPDGIIALVKNQPRRKDYAISQVPETIAANAHLIAAAPDLLALISKLYASTLCICGATSTSRMELTCYHCEAENLIAKTRGVKDNGN